MPIQVSTFPFLTPPPAKSQTSPRICYGFLTNPPRNHKSRQPLERWMDYGVPDKR